MITAASAEKWPRGRAHYKPSPKLNTPDSGQDGLVCGRGSELYGCFGHTSTPSTTIYTEAFKSIVSGIVSVG